MQRSQVRHLVRFLLVLRLICGLINGPMNLVEGVLMMLAARFGDRLVDSVLMMLATRFDDRLVDGLLMGLKVQTQRQGGLDIHIIERWCTIPVALMNSCCVVFVV